MSLGTSGGTLSLDIINFDPNMYDLYGVFQTFAKFLKVIVTLSLFGKIVIVIRYRYLTLRPNNFSLSVSLQKWK